MTFDLYNHNRTAERSGHRGDCAFTDNLGPSCNCEKLTRGDITAAMKMSGWTADERGNNQFGKGCFQRSYGKHIITLAHVNSGWQIKWEKGPGFTFLDQSGFGTIRHCLDFFWGTIAETMDEYMKASHEVGQLLNGMHPSQKGKGDG